MTVLLVWVALGTSLLAPRPIQDGDIDGLVDQLAADDLEVRDRAQHLLLDKGEAAVHALVRRFNDPDAELRGRVRRILTDTAPYLRLLEMRAFDVFGWVYGERDKEQEFKDPWRHLATPPADAELVSGTYCDRHAVLPSVASPFSPSSCIHLPDELLEFKVRDRTIVGKTLREVLEPLSREHGWKLRIRGRIVWVETGGKAVEDPVTRVAAQWPRLSPFASRAFASLPDPELARAMEVQVEGEGDGSVTALDVLITGYSRGTWNERVKSERVLKRVRDRLKTGKWHQRMDAADALAGMGGWRFALPLLRDDDPGTRFIGLAVLQRSAQHEFPVEEVAALLRDPDLEVREASIRTLFSAPSAHTSIAAMVDASMSLSLERSEAVALSLRQGSVPDIGKARMRDTLLGMGDDPSPQKRLLAVAIWTRWNDREAHEATVRRFHREEEPVVFRHVLRGMWEWAGLADPDYISLLSARAAEKEGRFADQCVATLVRIPGARARKAVEELAANGDTAIRSRLAGALRAEVVALSDSSLPKFLEMWRAKEMDAEVRKILDAALRLSDVSALDIVADKACTTTCPICAPKSRIPRPACVKE